MEEIVCLGKSDNGMVREERYCAKSGHGQRRAKEVRDGGVYAVDIRNVGSKETVLGTLRCVDLIIYGKKRHNSLSKEETEEAISTDQVPSVKMALSGIMA